MWHPDFIIPWRQLFFHCMILYNIFVTAKSSLTDCLQRISNWNTACLLLMLFKLFWTEEATNKSTVPKHFSLQMEKYTEYDLGITKLRPSTIKLPLSSDPKYSLNNGARSSSYISHSQGCIYIKLSLVKYTTN